MKRLDIDGRDVSNTPGLWDDTDIELYRDEDFKLHFREYGGDWKESPAQTISGLLEHLKVIRENANKAPG